MLHLLVFVKHKHCILGLLIDEQIGVPFVTVSEC